MKKGRIARDGATVRRCQVMLDEETVQRAKALGDGNISLGLRRAVKEVPWAKRGKNGKRLTSAPSSSHWKPYNASVTGLAPEKEIKK